MRRLVMVAVVASALLAGCSSSSTSKTSSTAVSDCVATHDEVTQLQAEIAYLRSVASTTVP